MYKRGFLGIMREAQLGIKVGWELQHSYTLAVPSRSRDASNGLSWATSLERNWVIWKSGSVAGNATARFLVFGDTAADLVQNGHQLDQ